LTSGPENVAAHIFLDHSFRWETPVNSHSLKLRCAVAGTYGPQPRGGRQELKTLDFGKADRIGGGSVGSDCESECGTDLLKTLPCVGKIFSMVLMFHRRPLV
jgi:hypothetical protein